jgi:hypothetical protein
MQKNKTRRLRMQKKNKKLKKKKKKRRYRHLAVKIDPLSFFADSQPSSGRLQLLIVEKKNPK